MTKPLLYDADQQAMLDLLHNERLAVLDGKDGKELLVWTLAWAEACAEEAMHLWLGLSHEHARIALEQLMERLRHAKE